MGYKELLEHAFEKKPEENKIRHMVRKISDHAPEKATKFVKEAKQFRTGY